MGEAAGVAIGGVTVVLLFLCIIFIPLLEDEEADLRAAEASTCVAVAEESEESKGKGPRIPNGWADEVEAAGKESGVPANYIAAQLEAESSWDEKTVNPNSGAAGLGQFMPGTWAMYGEGDPLDGVASIKAQGKYMKALMELAEPHADDPADQVDKAMAAYNWGPGSMEAVGWDLSKIPTETKNYLPKIKDIAQVKISADCKTEGGGKSVGNLGDGEWAHPLPNATLVSGWGLRSLSNGPSWANDHKGLDFATDPTVAATGPQSPAVALDDAEVVRASCVTHITMGCEVLIRLDNGGPMASYNHMDSIDPAAKVGAKVKRGQVLGIEGNKGGWRFGSHLHFEMYPASTSDAVYPGGSEAIDPTPLLREKGAM